MSRLVLASESPRRRELVSRLGLETICVSSDVDESLPENMSPEDTCVKLATKKALSVSKNFPSDIVIGCDTVVAAQGKILGKPKDEQDAHDMLSFLSGKTHSVFTGVCLVFSGHTLTFFEETEVEFYPLTEDEITKYIKTNEPFDKAGAYGIQEQGSLLVKRISGDYFNVMGLPVSKINQKLKEFGLK